MNIMYDKVKVFNLIILDESGSMQSIKSATIKGFNEVAQTIKGVELQFPEQEHFISLVSFNGLGIKNILTNKPVKHLEEIDENRYQPDSLTPLYDAMGFSITKLNKELEDNLQSKVLVTILTDGEENDSKEYSGESIKKLVDDMKQKGWAFTYIGANHDVEKFALSISITNTMTFSANEADMATMFSKEMKARYRYSQKIRDNEDIDKDFYKEDDEGNV
jgi:hypothetical protein